MAERTPLYMDINNVYSGDEFGLPWRDAMGEGVVGLNDLLVSAGTGNTINVAAGACWVVGDTDVVNQPTYREINDAVVNKGISPDPTNPRIVRVVMQMTDATFAGATRNGLITAIHGTPAASPAAPATPASALILADVLVPANAASSAAYTITDLRPHAALGANVGLRASHLTAIRNTTQSIPTTAQTTVIVNTVERLVDPRGIYALNSSTGIVTVTEAGIYLIAGTTTFASGTGDRLAILMADGAEAARVYMVGGFLSPAIGFGIYVSAGGTVRLDAYQTTVGALNISFGRLTITQLTRI